MSRGLDFFRRLVFAVDSFSARAARISFSFEALWRFGSGSGEAAAAAEPVDPDRNRRARFEVVTVCDDESFELRFRLEACASGTSAIFESNLLFVSDEFGDTSADEDDDDELLTVFSRIFIPRIRLELSQTSFLNFR